MRLRELFFGDREFAGRSTILETIRASRSFDATAEQLENAEFLLMFKTSKQQTWLVATEERLYCVLDDIREPAPIVRWIESRSSIISDGGIKLHIFSRDYSARSGIVDVGDNHKGWLFTKALFTVHSIEESILALIKRKMMRP